MNEINKNILKEIEDFCKEYNLDFSKVEMDSNGLWSYNDDIDFPENIYFKEFPKCFKYLKEIKGSLICSRTSINSFECFENLKSIGGDLNFYWTYIKDFKGLENLKHIGGSLNCSDTNLTSFKGLENLQTIGDGLYCYRTNIKSFEGLENVKFDISKIYPEERREEFLHFQKDLNFLETIEKLL